MNEKETQDSVQDTSSENESTQKKSKKNKSAKEQAPRNQILLTFKSNANDLELYNWLTSKYNTTGYIKEQLFYLMKYGAMRSDTLMGSSPHGNAPAQVPPITFEMENNNFETNEPVPTPPSAPETEVQDKISETTQIEEELPEGERKMQAPRRKVGGFA